MKLYTDKPNYVRLDDDVSFQILRTNPKLTTNTKLMYDGENLYMDSYSVNPLLSTMKYKHHRVWKTGLFNRDIRNFLLGTNSAAYEVGQLESDTAILNDFDNQFENIYWCGVEAINSDIYPQEMGCIAPLYLRKKRPNYFVIFKIDSPTNTNANKGDSKYSFENDIRYNTKILKAFDLREGTPIGDYIKRYVEQANFKYDQSIYVNFSTNEIYYYGIDKSQGVLTQKVENFKDQLLDNDNTILKSDDWITSGFERNNLVFPYILNLEFLFDDKDIQEYKFARYFGMYCNDIDLYDMSVGSCMPYTDNDGTKMTVLATAWDDRYYIDIYDDNYYYVKDKNKNIYSINHVPITGFFSSLGTLNEEDFKGFEKTSVSTYAERLPGVGKSFMILQVVGLPVKDEKIQVFDEYAADVVGTFVATTQLPKGDYDGNRFSCKGNTTDIAEALAGSIRECDTDQFKWITAFNYNNNVIIQATYPGESLNGLFNFGGDLIQVSKKIVKLNDQFEGGTSKSNCMFKVYTEDKNMFFGSPLEDRDMTRYLKCGIGRKNAKILSVVPYINEENKIDDTYSVLITDEMGPFVNVSKTNQIEILDKFYPKVGVLSFFPVKDFDFDTVESAYGDYKMFYNELKKLQDEKLNYSDSSHSGDVILNKNIVDIAPYKRFYEDNKDIETEYDYYCENIIPSLSTVSKSVPYIAKWGYIDGEKDSCENPYRLNMSKIFESCNFSANTFMQKGDMSEYTHSMPYYIKRYDTENNNEYQYIFSPEEWPSRENATYDFFVNYFSKKKSDGGNDPFDDMFGDVSKTEYGNKRFNKKYSRFLLGNDMIRSSTLFRGVKFEIREMDNGREITTGKYNDYRFSFIYIPVYEGDDENEGTEESKNKRDNRILFIKNDDYKFIVGIAFFYIKADPKNFNFNKAYVYAGSMGFLNKTK